MSKELEKFLRKRNAAPRKVSKFQYLYDDNERELDFYLKHGGLQRRHNVKDDFNRKPWEFIDTELGIPIDHIEMQVEATFVLQGLVVAEKLTELLTLAVLHSGISFNKQKMAPLRFGRKVLGMVSPARVFTLAIAVLLGEYDSALKLFEFFKNGYAKGWINRSKSHITDFIILLYGAYSNEILSSNVDNFAYQHIIADWNTTDANKITNYVQQLCDDQVFQVAAPPSKCFFEYDNLNWQFIPYPALMLLAIRQRSGLTNPTIEHVAFGNVSELTPILTNNDEPNPTFMQFQIKLEQQGFDIDKIFSKEQ